MVQTRAGGVPTRGRGFQLEEGFQLEGGDSNCRHVFQLEDGLPRGRGFQLEEGFQLEGRILIGRR